MLQSTNCEQTKYMNSSSILSTKNELVLVRYRNFWFRNAFFSY